MARSSMFYENGWHQQADKQLIGILKRALLHSTPYRIFDGDLAPAFLERFTSELNDCCKTDFPVNTVMDQINKLRMRHAVFDFVVNRSGVTWDNNNVLWAAYEEWEKIVLVHPLAGAYRDDRAGEEEWDDLEEIFGDKLPREEGDISDEEDAGDEEIDDGEVYD